MGVPQWRRSHCKMLIETGVGFSNNLDADSMNKNIWSMKTLETLQKM